MNIEVLNKDVAKEVLMIILYSNNHVQSSIPEEIIKALTNLASDSTLKIHFDKTKGLQEQNISNDALDTFSSLYYLYVASDNEKNDIYCNWIEKKD